MTQTTSTLPDPSSADSQSAKAILNQTLAGFGLQGLGDTVWNWYLAGKPIDQIMLDLRQTPEYQQRFPAMSYLSSIGHAMTESEYVGYEKSATELMRQYGLPSGFYDQPEDFTNLLKGQVGLPELQSRLDMYQQAAITAPPEVKQQLQNLYGVGQGALTAFFIDPDRALPLLTRQFQAASVAGAAQRTGFGQLTRGEAEGVAGLGVTPDAAAKGFATLANEQQLFQALPGESFGGIDRATQLAAGFGDNAQAIQSVEKERANRLAVFQGSEQFSNDSQGRSGIGSQIT